MFQGSGEDEGEGKGTFLHVSFGRRSEDVGRGSSQYPVPFPMSAVSSLASSFVNTEVHRVLINRCISVSVVCACVFLFNSRSAVWNRLPVLHSALIDT